ncbi:MULTISPECIES: hypothetical protein [unclassified Xanthobacter]|uniref:hypothetical protein n=1 Tax=unclassified Xanthobacter TaxID=2623496 RepID=UPI001F3B18AB|nr:MULTISPECIES: hypothetical protein [unclassified Xanthobacter]
MGEIVEMRPGQTSETILEFVRRKEVATTREVAYRFALGMVRAAHELAALRRSGDLVSAPAKDRESLNGAVRMNEWRLAAKPPAPLHLRSGA